MASTRKSADRRAVRPFLKWAGGKRRLVSQYEPFLVRPGRGRTYFEPFLGGGALFFHLMPRRAVLSDVNEELINCYRVVRDDLDDLLDRLAFHRDRHDREYYYEVRSMEPESLDAVGRAARFVYLNRTCYNGLYRVNASGRFNVPLGRYKRPFRGLDSLLASASEALRGTELMVSGFEHVLDRAARGDLVYFDPPYHPMSSTSCFTRYSKGDFGEKEQRRLADVFFRLGELGVRCMLSNSDHPFVRSLYESGPGVRLVEISAARAINSKACSRGAVRELLVLNY